VIWKNLISKKLNNVEVKEQYQVEIPNRFTALEDLVVVVMWAY
jgi:hypothetical protein